MLRITRTKCKWETEDGCKIKMHSYFKVRSYLLIYAAVLVFNDSLSKTTGCQVNKSTRTFTVYITLGDVVEDRAS